jgi:hypothetical protein
MSGWTTIEKSAGRAAICVRRNLIAWHGFKVWRALLEQALGNSNATSDMFLFSERGDPYQLFILSD